MASIGVFDSGYGGLTVLKEIIKTLPDHNCIYLGDNARTPYGSRSFETVYSYTLQSVKKLFELGCPLVVLACNTASAKALRSIQQKDLPIIAPEKRVLGVIRPTTEKIGEYTKTGKVGLLATVGTVASNSYKIEASKYFPNITLYQEACPLWVPIIENNEIVTPGAAYFIQKNLNSLLQKDSQIDTILLACTHYPLLIDTIQKLTPPHITLLSQGPIVSTSLKDYLSRHPEIDNKIEKQGKLNFYTTDSEEDFNSKATLFFGRKVEAHHIEV